MMCDLVHDDGLAKGRDSVSLCTYSSRVSLLMTFTVRFFKAYCQII